MSRIATSITIGARSPSYSVSPFFGFLVGTGVGSGEGVGVGTGVGIGVPAATRMRSSSYAA